MRQAEEVREDVLEEVRTDELKRGRRPDATADASGRDREAEMRAALSEMARSLHVGYLQRWGRHDPAGLERAAERTGSTSAA